MSLSTANCIKFCIATNKSLAIGTTEVDTLYNKIKFELPEAKISKRNGYVLLEKEK